MGGIAVSTAVNNVNGAFTSTFTVPISLDEGVYVLSASDNGGRTANATLSVRSPPRFPNLAPKKQRFWDDTIPVSGTDGIIGIEPTTPQSALPVKFGVALQNLGQAAAGPFHANLYIDNVLVKTWQIGGLDFSGGGGGETSWAKVDEISLRAGRYTFKLVVDPNNTVSESNEADNVYERSVTVLSSQSGGDGGGGGGAVCRSNSGELIISGFYATTGISFVLRGPPGNSGSGSGYTRWTLTAGSYSITFYNQAGQAFKAFSFYLSACGSQQFR